MLSVPPKAEKDRRLVDACLSGDAASLSQLVDLCYGFVQNFLRSRGASADEAEEITSELVCDCVVGRNQRGSLLRQYGAEAALTTWLARIARNRFLDKKRHDRFRARIFADEPQEEDHEPVEQGAELLLGDQLAIVRSAIASTLAECSPEIRHLLHLAYHQGIRQRQIARVLGWSECRVSRHLREVRRVIHRAVALKIKQQEPLLDLSFDLVLRAFREES